MMLNKPEKQRKKKIIAAFNAKKESGEPYDETEMFTQLARVNKIAIDKINTFESFISGKIELLKKSIIFVQEKPYGEKLQDVLVKYTDRYHTYYADDEKSNLNDFSEGKIECLLTCKKYRKVLI